MDSLNLLACTVASWVVFFTVPKYIIGINELGTLTYEVRTMIMGGGKRKPLKWPTFLVKIGHEAQYHAMGGKV